MIVSLARANLLHDWRRHATAIMVLVLAGLLMTIQLGFVAGFMQSFTALQKQTRADIIVRTGKPGASRMRGSRSVEERFLGAIWMHPDVTDVEPFGSSGQQTVAYLKDKTRVRISINSVDPSPDSMTFPRSFPESLREVLATPGTVVLPRASKREFDVKLGDKLIIGGSEAVIGGIVNGLPGSFQARVFASPQTVRLLTGNTNRFTSSVLVKIRNPDQARRVMSELNVSLPRYNLHAVLPDDLAATEGFAQILQGPGMILLGSAAFALLVGCGIASQTLRGAFLAQINEFGALRALGVRKRQLAWIAMEQAWWTGLVSIPIAIVIAFGIQAVASMMDVTIALPASLLLTSSVLLLVVALLAGVFSLTAITRAEPAELLR